MTHLLRLATLVALIAAAAPAVARAASFVVVDDKAVEELGETTRLYMDGRLVANFTLDATTTHKEIRVDAPDSPGHTEHQYALCGEIAYQAADGSRQVRQVSGQGMLPAPDGRRFMAVGANDFTVFYLIDPEDRMGTRPERGPSPFCQAPIS